MQIPKGKKIYFSSDNHLGAPTLEASLPREKKFVKWLDEDFKGISLSTSINENVSVVFEKGNYFARLD